MDYDEFVATYIPCPRCGKEQHNQPPFVSEAQRSAIKNFLRGHNKKLWRLKTGAGKTYIRRRLIQFLIDEEREESDGFHDWKLMGRDAAILPPRPRNWSGFTAWTRLKAKLESEHTPPERAESDPVP